VTVSTSEKADPMGTTGYPSDIYAQAVLQIEQGPSPPVSVSPAGCPPCRTTKPRPGRRRS
jgi:hypothetical protein